MRPQPTESPQAHRLERRPKVGVVLTFSGHYDSVRLLHRFMHHAGFDVITSQTSTRPIIEAGTSLASTDFCFPLRVYVGHLHTLSCQHPDLDAILAPNVWTDRMGSSTCCKYRDVGGVAIRSLGGMIPYLKGLKGVREQTLPRLIRPNIQSVTYAAMRNVAFDVYAEILGLPPLSRIGFFLPTRLRGICARHLTHVEPAFDRAWNEVMQRPDKKNLDLQLTDQHRPRLALVGRHYLIEDPALTADLKPWFKRRGAMVLTPWDVPRKELEPFYQQVEGFYDTHREGQAFVNWAAEKVDGFITLGSFGCHPDAFQVDFLAEHIRSVGKPAWTFRFDETAGNAGFQTRFETIYGFLEGLRDQRLRSQGSRASLPLSESEGSAIRQEPARPLFVWPYMGEELNLALEEAFVQMGLREFARPPRPIDGSTLELGSRRYAETCSPFACATGSLIQSVRTVVKELRDEASQLGEAPELRRIQALMLQGEGPCTFGWYALAQKSHLPADLAADLTDGHTVELITMGLEDPVGFLHQLGQLGANRRLDPVLRYVEAKVNGSWAKLRPLSRLRLLFGFQRALRSILGPAMAKLAAAEAVRARCLLVRAHELEQGATTNAYRESLDRLRDAHSHFEIRRARNLCLARLDALPQDQERKPRVVSVGEIYVALTSFANRGVIENMLGREGIEVVEGITLSGFIRRTLAETRRRTLANHPWIQPLRKWLEKGHISWLEQRPHDLRARPLMEWEIGGEGMEGVAAARTFIENGCDGIIHIYPFKCMPEGMAKDAYKEMSEYYDVRYLGLSFDKELDTERLKTEISTFTALLRAQVGDPRGWLDRVRLGLQRRTRGRQLDRLYRNTRHFLRPPRSIE